MQQEYRTDTPPQFSAPDSVYREYPIYRGDALAQAISDAYVDAGASAAFARLGTLWTTKEYRHAQGESLAIAISAGVLGSIPLIVLTVVFLFYWLLVAMLAWIALIVIGYQHYWRRESRKNIQSVNTLLFSHVSPHRE